MQQQMQRLHVSKPDVVKHCCKDPRSRKANLTIKNGPKFDSVMARVMQTIPRKGRSCEDLSKSGIECQCVKDKEFQIRPEYFDTVKQTATFIIYVENAQMQLCGFALGFTKREEEVDNQKILYIDVISSALSMG